MTPITRFSLATHDGPYEKWPRMTALFDDGQPTAAKLPGYVIEAQYAWQDYFLVITSHDCLFEETSTLLLLGPRFEILSRKDLFVMYGTYLLESHTPLGDDALRLVYLGGTAFSLTIKAPSGWIHPKPYLSLRKLDA